MRNDINTLLCEYFDGKEYETEAEMLEDVNRIAENIIDDIWKFVRCIENAPRDNADTLSITVKEYESEDDMDES